MDREAIDLMIDDITKTLAEMPDKKCKEYQELSASLRNLQDALIKDLTYEQNRIRANMEQELKEQEIQSNQAIKMRELEIKEKEATAKVKEAEAKAKESENSMALRIKELEMESELKQQELESRVRQEKTRARWGFFGAIGAAVLGLGGVLLECLSREKRVENLREIKEEQGIVDRDLVNLTR